MSLAGYSPWGHKELDVTENVQTHTAKEENKPIKKKKTKKKDISPKNT